MKKIYLLICLMIMSMILSADSYGVYSNISMSPYSTGKGETGVVLTGETEAMNVNPAVITGIGQYQVSVGYRQYYEGFNIAGISGGYKVANKHVIGIQIPYMMKSGMVSYDDMGDSTGVYGYSVLTPGIYYGIKLTEQISLGAGLRYLYQQLDDYNEGNLTGAIGMEYVGGGLRAGLSGINIGMSLSGDSVSYDAPYSINAGLGYRIGDIDGATQCSYTSGEGIKGSLGVEYGIMGIVYIRAGYQYKQNMTSMVNGLRGGLGINAGIVRVNYAITYDDYLGLTNMVGVSIGG